MRRVWVWSEVFSSVLSRRRLPRKSTFGSRKVFRALGPASLDVEPIVGFQWRWAAWRSTCNYLSWGMTPRGLLKKWPEIQFCEVKQRLMGHFLATTHELLDLHTHQ